MAVEVADVVVLAGSAIIRGEDDDGIVEDAAAFQLVYDAPDVLVHTVHHCCVHLHVGRLEGLVGLVFPRTARCVGGYGCLIRVNDAQLHHLLIAALTQDVPAVVIHALVLGYVLRLCLYGPVGLLESHIHEEGPAVGRHLVHHVDGLVCHKVGIVEVAGDALGEDGLLVVYEREGVEVVGDAPDGAPVLVEPSVTGIGVDGCERPVVERVLVRQPCHLVGIVADALRQREVPLAAHAGVVACLAQHFGNGDAVLGQALSHAGDAHGLGIAAREELCPRGTAAAGVEELCEADAVLSQSVEVGRVHFASETLQVGVAHVIDNDEHDVRTVTLLLRISNTGKQGGHG